VRSHLDDSLIVNPIQKIDPGTNTPRAPQNTAPSDLDNATQYTNHRKKSIFTLHNVYHLLFGPKAQPSDNESDNESI